jgi:glucose-1-phosphate thymidylyltransferase
MVAELKKLEVIGLIPAAGQASRLAPLPMSKELYPLGFRAIADGSLRPKVVSHYLLDNLRRGGIRKVYFLLRPGKWDIPAYYGSGDRFALDLGYLVVNRLDGIQHSINQAYPFVREAIVAVGYPDMLLQPETTYESLLRRLYDGRADVVIGAVPFSNPTKGGMVTFDGQDNNRVSHIVDKPSQSDAKYSWCSAVWKPTFSDFLHRHLAELDQQSPEIAAQEKPLGDMIQLASNHGLRVEVELFEQGHFLDVGTPEDLAKAILERTNLKT